MKQNVGKTDKVIRFVLAIVLFIIGLVAGIGTTPKVVVFVISGIAFFTALFGI